MIHARLKTGTYEVSCFSLKKIGLVGKHGTNKGKQVQALP
jgi:hypothetical protein